MNRRDVVKGGFAATAAMMLPGMGRQKVTRVLADASTGGIGLNRSDWEAVHGAGNAGQNVVEYEDGAYCVQYANDVIVYLEFGWENQNGISGSEAEAVVAQAIPSDAEEREGYDAPPTWAGPAGMRIVRYHSPALADLMHEVTRDRTGGILVVYQETPASDGYESSIFRICISVGEKPQQSILDRKSGFRGGLA